MKRAKSRPFWKSLTLEEEKNGWLDIVYLLIGIMFPILSIVGAERLNNGYNNEPTILLIILILILLGVLPIWPHSRNWGYYPGGGVGTLLLIIIILLLLGIV